jgi:DNA-binding NarL/FixJ family response regulator
MMAESKKRVFLVDDHPLVRERVAELIGRQPNWVVCGEAEDAPAAFKGILQTRPDMVILDITLKQSHGLELIKDLQQQSPGLPILVLSMHEESVYAIRAIRAGASGYICKLASSGEILAAIRRIMDGQIYLSDAVQQHFIQVQVGRPKLSADPLDQLSDRELEVFQLLGRGLGTRRIAQELRIGIKSVEVYRARIKQKFHLTDGIELLVHAIEWAHGMR